MGLASENWAAKVVIFFLFLAFFHVAKAAENIEIPNDGIKVYAKSDIASPVIGTLHAGQVVPAATNPVGNFRKVMIVTGGVKKIGYINLFEVKGELKVATAVPVQVAIPVPSPLPPPQGLPPATATATGPGPVATTKAPQTTNRRVVRRVNYGLHGRSALDLILGIEYQNQGSATYSDGNGGQDRASSLSGSQPIFGLGFQFPLKYNILLEPYFLYKAISVTGTLTPTGPAANAGSAFILAQNYISLGVLAKFYGGPSSGFWYGGGLQLDHGISGSIQIGSNNPIPSNQGSLPNLILIYAASGLDFPVSRSLFLVPNLRLGAMVNVSPPILDVSANINILKAF